LFDFEVKAQADTVPDKIDLISRS